MGWFPWKACAFLATNSLSTLAPVEICEYPDSGKFGVFEDLPHAPEARHTRFRHLGRREDARDYWEGE